MPRRHSAAAAAAEATAILSNRLAAVVVLGIINVARLPGVGANRYPPFGLSTATTSFSSASPCASALAGLRARSVDLTPDDGGLDATVLIEGFETVRKTSTVWALGTPVCPVAALFAGYAVDPATPIPLISFQVLVEDVDIGAATDLGTGLDSLVSLETGRMSLTVRTVGRYRVWLQATTPRSDRQPPVNVTDFVFHVRTGPHMQGCGDHGTAIDPDPLGENTTFRCACVGKYVGDNCQIPPDTASPANGPNNTSCSSNSIMHDAVPYDQSFTCNCTAGYGGDNCQTPPDTSASAGGSSDGAVSAATVIGAVVFLGLAAVVLFAARGRLAALRVVAQLHSFAKRTDATAAESDAYTAAMFEALDLGIDQLVPALVARGADPDARHPITHQLAHAIVLSRPDPDCEVLEPLFRSSCLIDAEIGALVAGPQQRVALEAVLVALAVDPPPNMSGTMLHTVVEACLHGHLGADHAVAFSERLLADFPSLLITVDELRRTAGDIAMQCDKAVELERLLTVVLHNTFQLTHPSEPIYRSPTALVLDCRILPTTTSDTKSLAQSDWAFPRRGGVRGGRRDPSRGLSDGNPTPLVIKLITDLGSWQREIHMRDALLGAAGESVVQIVSVASSDPDAPEQVGTMVLVCDPFVGQGPGGRVRHGVASDLTAEFPYAIVMEKADRNLLEIITNERLSAGPIGLIRFTAAKIGVCIATLHASGTVHGDIKPRNVVRTANHTFGNTFKLIDLDMAYVACLSPAAGAATGLPHVHASAKKIRETSAYASPELIRWAQVGGAGRGATDPITNLASAAKTDIWSFGMLLYELITGRPLLAHAYDKASTVAEARLRAWDGLQKSEEMQLHTLHPSEDATALIDLLQWCLTPTQSSGRRRWPTCFPTRSSNLPRDQCASTLPCSTSGTSSRRTPAGTDPRAGS